MVADTAITAKGKTDICALSFEAKYQATPPSSKASVTRSMTESKNAPRWLAVLPALATAPSRRSGNAAKMTSNKPRRNAPAPTEIPAATARSKPATVSTSGVTPTLRNDSPIGFTARSTCTRKWPSNMGKSYFALSGKSGFASVSFSTTEPLIASTSTNPRRIGGSSAL